MTPELDRVADLRTLRPSRELSPAEREALRILVRIALRSARAQEAA